MHEAALSGTEKQTLFDDGFIVLRNAVPPAIVQAARSRIDAALPRDERQLLVPAELATHPEILALFNDGCLAGLLRREMGPLPDVVSCQIAVTPPYDKLGGGRVVRIEEPIYGGANGALKIAHDMPAEYWEQLK